MHNIVLDLPELPFEIEEALNRLRVNIRFCGSTIKKIMVTSTVPNEGKSIVSFNLWKMLADAGFKTVYLDLDLRKSYFQNRYGIDLKRNGVMGVDYYLSGQAEYNEVLCSTNVENGYVIPVTNLLENPSNLFEDVRFKQLLELLNKDFRYIIIDTPPILEVSDASLIAGSCDGTVFVIRSGFVSRKLIRQALDQIEITGCRLLGMVLNRVDNSKRKYGYYGKKYGYGYNYGSGYGYGREHGRDSNAKKAFRSRLFIKKEQIRNRFTKKEQVSDRFTRKENERNRYTRKENEGNRFPRKEHESGRSAKKRINKRF